MLDTQQSPLVSGGHLCRFSSRLGRLDHVYLRDRLQGATEYLRIAGYFRSSIFDLVGEDIEGIASVKIVCNSDLDPEDIHAARLARTTLLKERWNQVDDHLESFLRRPRYQRLYEILKKGNVEVRVVSRSDAPFLHGKAGVIRQPDGTAAAFMGSLNETLEGWSKNYELVWEDTSPEGIAWVEAEFKHLWDRSVPLPEAIVEEIGRCARKREVVMADLAPEEVGPAALVEAPIYRQGEELKPWQQAFVGLFLEHRNVYGSARLLLADEVGVGKTLSLAGSALVACLLGDGPALILCPATLCDQWQVELQDKLGIPSAVWLSSKKMWRDHTGHPIRTSGAEDVARCPYQIGIVSTGLIMQDSEEKKALLKRRLGTLIFDEAHRGRLSRGPGEDAGRPNNLLAFMQAMAANARHVILGTATPIQTDVEELWDLLDVLNRGADHVLGRTMGAWRQPKLVIPILTGEKDIAAEREAWDLIRNPLPPKTEATALFDMIRSDLGIPADEFFTAQDVSYLEPFTRDHLRDDLAESQHGLGFFRRNNPMVRHVVLRRRSTLEDKGLLPRIAVDISPIAGNSPPMFDGLALRTAPEFDMAYEAAKAFSSALGRRKNSAGFMRTMLLGRICSSYASGLSTAQKLFDNRDLGDEEDDALLRAPGTVDLIEEERAHLLHIIDLLSAQPEDPKLQAVRHYLLDRGWLKEHGCIVFSQYYDTADWVARSLAETLPEERVAVYAGAGKSKVFLGGECRSAEREHIKTAVRDRQVRLVIATDAACEGLNLQTLGALINVDLPWNPSRLEQRIGRIKRFGQRRDRVDMLSLVYKDTVDEQVYATLSRRMKDRYFMLGSLPDVIRDDWIDDIEHLEERMAEYTESQKQANAFDLRYGDTIEPEGPGWELCEKVLARADVIERLSRGW
jgi:superfamily II DNA or RNA helicase